MFSAAATALLSAKPFRLIRLTFVEPIVTEKLSNFVASVLVSGRVRVERTPPVRVTVSEVVPVASVLFTAWITPEPSLPDSGDESNVTVKRFAALALTAVRTCAAVVVPLRRLMVRTGLTPPAVVCDAAVTFWLVCVVVKSKLLRRLPPTPRRLRAAITVPIVTFPPPMLIVTVVPDSVACAAPFETEAPS